MLRNGVVKLTNDYVRFRFRVEPVNAPADSAPLTGPRLTGGAARVTGPPVGD